MGTILIGSLPGVLIGERLSRRVPAAALRPALGCVMLGSALGVMSKAGVDLSAWVILGAAGRWSASLAYGSPAQSAPRASGAGSYELRARPPARPRVRGDPRHARGRRGVRAPRDAVQRRQGLDRDAAPGREGVPAGALPVPADARRHRPQLPRGHRVPRPPRRASWASGWSSPRCRSRSTRAASSRRPGRARRATGCRPCTLLDAIHEHGFDAAFGGARRDEERARAKERIFSFRDDFGDLGSQEPAARAVEPLQRAHQARRARAACSRSPTGPSSTSGSTSPPSASRSRRSTTRTSARSSARDGMLYATSEFTELMDGEEPFEAWVRYRTVGDMSCTGAVRLDGGDARGRRRRRSRRRGSPSAARRARTTASTEAAMEDRKKRGLLLDGVRRPSPLPGHRRAAAHRHRGLGRRRQVDADRPAALRLQADLRGPARAGRRRRPSAATAPTARSTSRC